MNVNGVNLYDILHFDPDIDVKMKPVGVKSPGHEVKTKAIGYFSDDIEVEMKVVDRKTKEAALSSPGNGVRSFVNEIKIKANEIIRYDRSSCF